MPKLACADFTFPLLSHDKVLDLIALLDFEGVDIGLFEGRSHLWPSRVFEDVTGLGAGAGGQAPRPRPRAGRRLPPDRPRLRVARPEPSRCGASEQGPRLVREGRRIRGGVRVAGTSPPCRASTSTASPSPTSFRSLLRRAGLAVRDGPRRRDHVRRRGPRRLDRPDARRRGRARPRGPGPDADARLHPLHPLGHPRLRGRAADRPRQPLPRPRRPRRPAPGVVQGQRDRLRPRPRRHAAGRAIRATSASSTSGSTGSTATRSTTCPRRSCSATSCVGTGQVDDLSSGRDSNVRPQRRAAGNAEPAVEQGRVDSAEVDGHLQVAGVEVGQTADRLRRDPA